MYILDVGTRWVKYQREVEEGLIPNSGRKEPSQEDLLAMIEKAKQKQGANAVKTANLANNENN